MKYLRRLQIVLVLLLFCGSTQFLISQDSPKIIVEEYLDGLGFFKHVPVSISGFSKEAENILADDLYFMGISNAPQAQAQYLITGNNSGERVEGRVQDKVTKKEVFAKAYAGGSLRTKMHALADDIAKQLTGLNGIAQTKIAFKAEAGLGKSEIYISDWDGHNPIPVTKDGTIVSAPAWAGKQMLYYSSYKQVNPRIFSHNLPTGARQLITPFNGANISPAVSPDGKKLAMILSKSGAPNLYVSELNGTNLKQLTSSREGESSPCWSPDSKTICFVSRERGAPGLYTIPASGGEKRRLANDASNPTEPDWSPDGKWIVFTSQARGFSLYMIPSQGGRAIALVDGEDPVWAPNSRAVIFCRGRDHQKTLSLLDVPSKRVKTIARILESNSQPSWAR